MDSKAGTRGPLFHLTFSMILLMGKFLENVSLRVPVSLWGGFPCPLLGCRFAPWAEKEAQATLATTSPFILAPFLVAAFGGLANKGGPATQQREGRHPPPPLSRYCAAMVESCQV